jgi:putative transposase
MKRSRFTESQIVEILKEADAGLPPNEVWRKHGISSATYYTVESQVRRAGSLRAGAGQGTGIREQHRLKRMYAELALENEAIKGLLKKL